MLRLAEQMKKETYVTSHFEFTFRLGGHKGEAYEVDLLDSSISMTELHTTLELEISSFEKPRFYYIIGLDTENEISAILDTSSLIDRNFTKAFIAELGKEDWSFLSMYNKVIRNGKSEDFTDFKSLEVDFSGRVESIEKQGKYVRYPDIFPNARIPSFIYKGERYYILDEYYVTHDITLHDSALSCMVMEKDQSFDWRNPKTRLGVLDYETQVLSPYEKRENLDQAFFSEVQKQLPNLASLVKQRHANLRLVYENYCKRENLHFPAPKAPAIVQSFSPEQDTEPLANLFSLKVGRNDPCPCGSGKKYKKCCMN